ncbi:MAG: hypothetical protein ACLFVP_09815 [Candidatus Bathyarchaeia archaeon]
MSHMRRREKLIIEISADRMHGAEYLSTKALRNLKKIALDAQPRDAEGLLQLLEESAVKIAESKQEWHH